MNSPTESEDVTTSPAPSLIRSRTAHQKPDEWEELSNHVMVATGSPVPTTVDCSDEPAVEVEPLTRAPDEFLLPAASTVDG